MTTEYDQNGCTPGLWVAVNTHPRKERIAIDNLARQEFRTYCPMINKQRGSGRRTMTVLRPLFPGYILVQVDLGFQRWRPLLSTIGVRRVIRCGDRLSFIAGEFVEGLKAREIDGAIVKPESPYRVGQEVKITVGAFDGLVAQILEMDERGRLVVLMDLLNQGVKVKIDAQGVTAI